MQRSSTVVQEVAHFTKCNYSPNVIADTASIPFSQVEKEEEKKGRRIEVGFHQDICTRACFAQKSQSFISRIT